MGMLENKSMNIGSQTARGLVGKLYSGRSVLVVAGMMLLSGCDLAMSHIEDWSSIPEMRKPVASRAFYTHDVLFGPSEVTVNDSEGKRLKEFVDNAHIGETDKVYLVSGDNRFGKLRTQAIGALLAASNIKIASLPGRVGIGVPPGDAISVVISRYVVTLPACPDWTSERFTYNNVPTSNWGCANAVNLGRMVANPGDLVRGRDPGSFDGEYATRSIDLYRKGETKPLTLEDVGPIKGTQQQPAASSGGN